MRGMTMTRNGVIEAGKADTVTGGTPILDNGGTWLYAGTTGDGKPVITQQLETADPELRAYIVQNTTGSAVPSLITYSGSYVDQPISKTTSTSPSIRTATCGYGDANCAAGLQPSMTAEELAQRRNSAADIASSVSTQAGRFSAAATAYGTVLASSPDPLSKAGAVTQFGLAGTATVIGFGAQTVDQLLRPNAGQGLYEGALGLGAELMIGKFPTAAPLINEASQTISNHESSVYIKSWINEKWNSILKTNGDSK